MCTTAVCFQIDTDEYNAHGHPEIRVRFTGMKVIPRYTQKKGFWSEAFGKSYGDFESRTPHLMACSSSSGDLSRIVLTKQMNVDDT